MIFSFRKSGFRNFAPLLLLALLVLFAPAQPAHSQDATSGELKVLVKPIAPFVMRDNGTLSGYSIDLWRELATRAGLDSRFIYVDTLTQLFDGIKDNSADVAIAAVTITRGREVDMDFSHAYFQSGLQVLVAGGNTSIASKVWPAIVSTLTSPTFVIGFAAFISFVFFAANIYWLLERRRNDQISRAYFRGVWDAFWWSLVTVSTVGYGDMVPKTHSGRLLSVLWIIFGYLGFTWFTAVVTSTVTVSQLTGGIDGPGALSGRSVATIEGSTSAKWLAKNVPAARLVLHDNINKAYDNLLEGVVEAVVYDAPSVLFFANNRGKALTRTAGAIFNRESYGIVFPIGSPLREKVNQALLEIGEDGFQQQLMEKWFGAEKLP